MQKYWNLQIAINNDTTQSILTSNWFVQSLERMKKRERVVELIQLLVTSESFLIVIIFNNCHPFSSEMKSSSPPHDSTRNGEDGEEREKVLDRTQWIKELVLSSTLGIITFIKWQQRVPHE